MSHYRSFREFYSYMGRNLIEFDIRILFDIEKAKHSLVKILSFSCDKYNIFTRQAEFFC